MARERRPDREIGTPRCADENGRSARYPSFTLPEQMLRDRRPCASAEHLCS
ncbi:hypothetical protein FHS98_001164 [Sphingomonas oligoaromativorans]|nr:hypothetical protein [Sphingomonas oligoaromativorans]